MTDAPYTPPEVWTWDKENGGQFANINRPIAGPTHDKELPVGKHPLQLYSLATPNGVKGDDHARGAAGGRPQGRRIRRLADQHQRGRPVRLGLRRRQSEFEDPGADGPQRRPAGRASSNPARSCSISPRSSAPSCPTEQPARTECLNWLFWQMGSAPYLGGGFGHFYAYAPEKWEYPINRFAMEVKRQIDVLDRRLAETEYLGGRRIHHRRHGGLAVVWRPGEGRLYGDAANSSRSHELQERAALGRRDRAAPRGEARPHGQPRHRRSCRASCTNATTLRDFETQTQDKLEKA